MKDNSLLTGLSCMLASAVLLYACQKEISPSRSTPSLTASSTNAVTGEKITLNVTNAPSGTHLMWTSTSASNALFAANGTGSANVSFTKPGTYTITCYFVSGDTADSLPNHDTTGNPYDTLPNYYPPPPPVDSTNYPHDSVPSNPGDTMPNYPHDTVPNYPPPPPNDSTYYPQDSTYIDSLAHASHGHIVSSVTITITVH